MKTATNDLDEAFWTRIEERPDDPLPRLLFADWCDENDWPEMGDLQRWLAATGRRPFRYQGQAIWFTGENSFTDEVLNSYAAHTIPCNLAMEVRLTPPAMRRSLDGEGFFFPSQRASEEALAEAWKRSRRWRQLLCRFRPDYSPLPSRDLSAESPRSYDNWVELPSPQGYMVKVINLVSIISMGTGIYFTCRHWGGGWPVRLGYLALLALQAFVAVSVCLGGDTLNSLHNKLKKWRKHRQ